MVYQRIEKIKITELREHEEIDNIHLRHILRDVLEKKYILTPIIVDEKTLTIIDGHHRYNILKIIGARYAPIVFADYNNDIEDIKSNTIRITTKATNTEKVIDKIYTEIKSIAKKEPHTIKIITNVNNKVAVLELNADLLDSYIAIKEIYRNIDTLEKESSSGYNIIIAVPPLKSNHIRKIADMGMKLLPRSTIHITVLKRIRSPVKITSLC